ncbi:CASP-like protein 1B2 [Cinnamomum micranthum f. kanehirae]|uniref:CASP-like protein n=1 Tax=Cinnamomum micranthum f. kanehirae TaxID=337451 RepID=A0A3S3N5L9_9MAGN|nr:CASP-like protein 1B2 [Cinnamomum micranthum f. kanehirae]
MAVENGGSLENGSGKKPIAKSPEKIMLIVLRLLALGATFSATLVMALNKETKSIVVPLGGSNSISATLTAKFQHTPAFVFFVIANSIASFHNLSLLLLRLFGKKFEDIKGLGLLITISDMVMVALVSGGAAAAASMAELGKNGNSHARWNKICDKFDAYCDRGGGALIASFAGVGLLMVLNALATVNLYKNPATH